MKQKAKMHLPFQSLLDAEKARHEALLSEFGKALAENDVNAIDRLCTKIDQEFLWPQAIRCVLRIEREFSRDVRDYFLRAWIRYGDLLRQEADGDLTLSAALRKLLPRYRGGDVLLYRGELWRNRTRRTYGLSWSSQRRVADSFAKDSMHRHGEGGTVLLKAKVPASAIIAKIPTEDDRHGEREFLVDRRGLVSDIVQVIRRYAHLPLIAGGDLTRGRCD